MTGRRLGAMCVQFGPEAVLPVSSVLHLCPPPPFSPGVRAYTAIVWCLCMRALSPMTIAADNRYLLRRRQLCIVHALARHRLFLCRGSGSNTASNNRFYRTCRRRALIQSDAKQKPKTRRDFIANFRRLYPCFPFALYAKGESTSAIWFSIRGV